QLLILREQRRLKRDVQETDKRLKSSKLKEVALLFVRLLLLRYPYVEKKTNSAAESN
ncbi:MAG: hypothetical protein ACJAVW_000165, partial [Spirosomataceae bacterium]